VCVCVVLRIEPKDSHTLVKHSTTEPHSQHPMMTCE
jgi:hypothetical protein